MGEYFSINHEALCGYTTEVLEKMGLPRESAETEAKSLIWANIRGIDSHGVQRLELLSYFIRVGCRFINFVDGDDDRNVGCMGVVDGFFCLWHHVIFGCYHNDGNIGDFSTAGAHGSKCFVSGRI